MFAYCIYLLTTTFVPLLFLLAWMGISIVTLQKYHPVFVCVTFDKERVTSVPRAPSLKPGFVIAVEASAGMMKISSEMLYASSNEDPLGLKYQDTRNLSEASVHKRQRKIREEP